MIFVRILDRLVRLFSAPPVRKRRSLKERHEGEHYHLKELYDEVNERYFKGALDLRITWIGNKALIPRRCVLFGSYTPERRLIKIHRRLDQPHIPRYFISFVIYHEMLHHVAPPFKKGGRRRVHHGEFREKEREFAEYALAKEFIPQVLQRGG